MAAAATAAAAAAGAAVVVVVVVVVAVVVMVTKRISHQKHYKLRKLHVCTKAYNKKKKKNTDQHQLVIPHKS